MNESTYYQLNLPSATDPADISKLTENFSKIDTALHGKLDTPITSDIDLNGHRIKNIGSAQTSEDVATVGDVSVAAMQVADAALFKSGGTMTGDINMASHKITGLLAPTSESEAANKGYVDKTENYSLIKTITLTQDANSIDLLTKSENIVLEGSFFIVGAIIFGTTDATPYASLRRDGGSIYYGYGYTYTPTEADVSEQNKRYWYRWVRPCGNYDGSLALVHFNVGTPHSWAVMKNPPNSQGLSNTSSTDAMCYTKSPDKNLYYNDNLNVFLKSPNYFKTGTQFFIYGREKSE